MICVWTFTCKCTLTFTFNLQTQCDLCLEIYMYMYYIASQLRVFRNDYRGRCSTRNLYGKFSGQILWKMPTEDWPKRWRSSETEIKWIWDVYDAIFSIFRVVFRTQLLVGYFILHSEFRTAPPLPLTSVRIWGSWSEFCEAPSTKKSSLKIF